MAIYLIEVLLMALVAVGGITQIIVPLWRNTPLFPYFSRRQELMDTLKHVRGEIDEEEISKRIDFEIDRHNRGQKEEQPHNDEGNI